MAAKRILFGKDAKSLVLDTSENYGIGQYFQINENGADGTDDEYSLGKCMKLTISRINYKKTIYKPGYANVEMTIDNFSSFQDKKYVDALKVYFLYGQRTLEIKNSKLDSTSSYIKDYYITDLALKQKLIDGSRVTVVVLKAYSPDYFLTLNKYSKTYRGKTLSKIIDETLTSTFSGDASILKSRFQHANLCHTTVNTDGKTELLQPYLVQYNESFHDFVVRTANRCGELFYYEDGKLILGVDDSNIKNDDNKSIIVRSIKGALPEDMVFSSIPSPFIKEVKPIDKSYLNNLKSMEKAGDIGLFCNRNIESVDTLRTITDDDSLKKDKLTECHWMEVGNKMLGAGGALDIITAGTSKAADIGVTAELMHKGYLLPNKSKITIQDCEKELNNLYHSNVAATDGNADAVKAFKEAYMKAHPEEFCKFEIQAYDPFSESGTKASLELTHYLDEVLMATRDHKERWKKTYIEDHPDMFSKEVPLDDKDIFAAGTKGKELLDKFIEDNTIRINNNQEEINKFKQEYEAGRGHEDFKDKSANARKNIWFNPESQAYKDLEAALSAAGLPPTDADIANAKIQIKQDNPELCKKTVPMTEKEVQELFNDTKSQYRKDFEDYMVRFGNNRDAILTTKKEIEANECKTFFTNVKEQWQEEHRKENIGFSESVYDEAWKESIGHPKDEKLNPPYNAITTRFKNKYKDDPKHKSEFQTTVAVEDKSDAKWAAGTAAANALAAYLENKKDKANFSNSFYNWIETAEKLNSESIQVHRLSDKKIPEYKLAQYYTLDSTTDSQVYLINQVEVDIYAESTGQNAGNGTEAAPVYKVDANITISKTEQNKARSEKYDYMNSTFPPLADNPHIRKSEPQIAYVTDNADPLRAGRVQIRYPWMTEEAKPVNANGDVIKNVKNKDASPQYSPWIPVLVPFVGGEESGFLMTPDVDDIVMVNYEGGNIERPYVDGSVFCGAGSTYWGKTPLIPKANDFRGSKHVISYKGNGISFVPGSADAFSMGLLPSAFTGPMLKWLGDKDPKKEGEKKYKGAQETFHKNMKIGGSMVLTDHYGMYNISMSSASRSIDIESPWGNVNLNAFSGITISAPNGDIKISGKNVTIEAGNNIKMVSGKNIKGKHANTAQEITNALAQVAGAAAGAALKYTIKNTLAVDLGKALDLSFVRNIWEIIFRPVEGALSLNSKRNLMLEAGGGKVIAPSDTLSKAAKAKKGSVSFSSLSAFKKSMKLKFLPTSSAVSEAEAKENDNLQPMNELDKLMLHYFTTVDDFVAEVVNNNKSFASTFNSLVTKYLPVAGSSAGLKIQKEDYNTPEDLMKKIIEGNKLIMPSDEELADWIKLSQSKNSKKRAKRKGKPALEFEIATAKTTMDSFVQDFNKIVKSWKQIYDNLFDGAGNILLEKLKNYDVSKIKVKKEFGFAESKVTSGLPTTIASKKHIMKALGAGDDSTPELDIFKYMTNEEFFAGKAENAKKILKKLAYCHIVQESDRYTLWQKVASVDKKISKAIPSFEDMCDADKWKTYAASIKFDKVEGNPFNGNSLANSFLKSAGLGDLISYDEGDDSWSFLNSFQQTLNFNGKSGPRSVWDVSSKRGAILMSGRNGKTLCLGRSDNGFEPISNPKKTNDLLDILEKL